MNTNRDRNDPQRIRQLILSRLANFPVHEFTSSSKTICGYLCPFVPAFVLAVVASFAQAQTAVVPNAPDEKLPPAKTADEIESRYLQILTVMKNPPATGLLVAELGPYSAGANAGIRPGDVLVEYLGVRLDKPKEKDRTALLRNTVTRAIDEQARKDINPMATLIVLRNGKNIVLAAERMPLGIFTIPVEKGAELPLNPAESERGSFTTEWAESDTWLRVGEAAGAASAERHTLSLQEKTLTFSLSASAMTKPETPVEEIQRAAFSFTITDRATLPAMTLQRFSYVDESIDVTATRRGGVIRGKIDRKLAHVTENVERPTLSEAIPTLAVPHIAGALPQEKGIVIHFATISELDLQTRPGYALETRGKVKTTIDEKEIEAFAVRLWHLGQPEAEFYFDDKRRLLSARYEAGGVSMIRAANQTDAFKAMVTTKPASRAISPELP